MNALKMVAVVVASVMATGCLSSKQFDARMSTAGSTVNECMRIVASAQAQQPTTQPIFEDSRDYAIYVMAQALAKPDANPYQDCNSVALAIVNGDARTRNALISGGVNVLGIGLGVYGATAIVDSIADLADSAGGVTYNNSRVLDASGGGLIRDSSASGTTTNVGTTSAVNESDALGGIQPRQSFTVGDFNDGQSLSGTNGDPIVLPGENSFIAPLPAEE